jgi:hypothetical protein
VCSSDLATAPLLPPTTTTSTSYTTGMLRVDSVTFAWGAAPVDDFAKFPAFCFDDEAQAVFICVIPGLINGFNGGC